MFLEAFIDNLFFLRYLNKEFSVSPCLDNYFFVSHVSLMIAPALNHR